MPGMRGRGLLLGSTFLLACPAPTEPTLVPLDLPPQVRTPDEPDPPEAEAVVAPMELREVAPGITAVLQPAPRRFADSNAAIIETEEGTVIIDGPQSLWTADWLWEQVQARASSSRRILVTTHWHLDHSLSSARWRTQAEDADTIEHWGHAGLDMLLQTRGQEQLVEHREAVRAMITRGEQLAESGRQSDGTELTAAQREQLQRELQRVSEQADMLDGMELVTPTHHVEQPTSIALAGLTVELRPVIAHTDADLVVYVPEAKVLFSGDVLDEIPFGGHGRPGRWLAVLEELRALELEAIVPGHGGVMEPAALDRAIALWTAVLGQAELAVGRGETAQQRFTEWEGSVEYGELRDAMVSDGVSMRAFDAFVPESLARAVAERKGELAEP